MRAWISGGTQARAGAFTSTRQRFPCLADNVWVQIGRCDESDRKAVCVAGLHVWQYARQGFAERREGSRWSGWWSSTGGHAWSGAILDS